MLDPTSLIKPDLTAGQAQQHAQLPRAAGAHVAVVVKRPCLGSAAERVYIARQPGPQVVGRHEHVPRGYGAVMAVSNECVEKGRRPSRILAQRRPDQVRLIPRRVLLDPRKPVDERPDRAGVLRDARYVAAVEPK